MTRGSVILALLASCAAPVREPALQRDLHQAAAAARIAFDAGDLARARALFEHAFDLARRTDDVLAIGNVAYCLSIVAAEQGDSARANLLLADATAGLQRAAEPLLDVWLLQARLAWLAGDPQSAQRALDAVLASRAPPPSPEQRSDAELLRGELACDRVDLEQARAALAQAAGALGEDAAHTETPSLLALAARIEEVAGGARDAAALYDRAADALQRARLYRRMADALVRAAQAYAAADAPAVAGDRFVRAAQSRLGARDRARAREWLQRASTCAAQSGDDTLRARVTALARELGDPAPTDGR